ncbi:MAG TPA: chemotaxis protein CheW [Anaeromyxobacteraceae bacterium]|nr:chemotaxis protein CheW [Anaeromyxobacteraceae bacterium]
MSPARAEILLFQVGARVYASLVGDVRRIGSAARGDLAGALTATALGEPFEGRRGLVVAGQDGDRTLSVDQVLGVREVSEADLRPLPPLAAHCLASAAVTGLAMVDEVPTLLVDLSALIREELRGGAAAPGQGRHRA